MRHLTALVVLAAACKAPSDTAEATFAYPLDDVLSFADLQAIGTHNSYHLKTTDGVEEWDYSHAPLDVQLGQQGVRQFELDVYYDEADGVFSVQHIPLLDAGTTCAWFTECLAVLKGWSDRNPAHHPLMVLVELKEEAGADAAEQLDALDAELRSVWPDDRLVTPDLVQGSAPSLLDALDDGGWPTLGELRGRALFVVHDGGDWRDAYLRGNDDPSGRAMFPDAQDDLDAPFAAVHTLNDPVGDAAAIATVLARNHLVRTRVDPNQDGLVSGDAAKLDAGIASGAQFLSTDYPAPVDGYAFVAAVPGGTPSGCNPVTAPAECTSEAVEDPAFITP